MKTTARTHHAPGKVGHPVDAKPAAKKADKAEKTEHKAKAETTHHVKDGHGPAGTNQKAFHAKAGAGAEVARTPAHQTAAGPLNERVNKALDELGVHVGVRVVPYNSGDWMDYAHELKADRAVQVHTLGDNPQRLVLQERKDPDRLVLMDENEVTTHASALVKDFPSFAAAVKSVLSEQLGQADALKERMLHPHPATPAAAEAKGPKPQPLTAPQRTLLEGEVRALSRDLTSLKQQLDGISKSYGYTRPWAMDEGREQFTLVNGRFDVLGYDRHLKTVKADQGTYDRLNGQIAEKSGQLDLKMTQLKTGLQTDVG